MFEIYQEFGFEAAHHFPNMPPGHKYHGVHGHSFRVRVTIAGEPRQPYDFVADLGELERSCLALREQLDHKYLNEIPSLQQPSLENIARWVWNALAPSFPGLAKVTVSRDSCGHGCIYSGPAS
ncbi:MAG TPA: 6-carboxytetrahydropterin synthase [Burkholderiales bacterium]|nr:6-carboxytetrahydropterin synthase [Burkholderiales bacterium]